MQQIQSPTFRLRVATPEKKIIPIKEAPSAHKSDAPLSLSYKENKEAKALAMLEYRNLFALICDRPLLPYFEKYRSPTLR